MKLDKHAVAKMLDYSVLNPDTQEETIREACALTREYDFAALYVNPCWVSVVARELAGTGIEIGATISFPFGTSTSEVKLLEAQDAVKNGATALDMVINIGALKDGKHEVVRSEIANLVQAAQGGVTKVIMENGMLTRDEIVAGCKLAEEAGSSFVKSSTGRNARGVLLDEIRLMRESVSPSIGVKASGFGLYLPAALAAACIKAGADRLGTGGAKEIVDSVGLLDFEKP